jgi:hypothetical protein
MSLFFRSIGLTRIRSRNGWIIFSPFFGFFNDCFLLLLELSAPLSILFHNVFRIPLAHSKLLVC